jgi:hypothetical protein
MASACGFAVFAKPQAKSTHFKVTKPNAGGPAALTPESWPLTQIRDFFSKALDIAQGLDIIEGVVSGRSAVRVESS